VRRRWAGAEAIAAALELLFGKQSVGFDDLHRVGR
jgi:hypothetical protein